MRKAGASPVQSIHPLIPCKNSGWTEDTARMDEQQHNGVDSSSLILKRTSSSPHSYRTQMNAMDKDSTDYD